MTLHELRNNGSLGNVKDKRPTKKDFKKHNAVIYSWWAFEKEADIHVLNKNGWYPRDLGKGSRPAYDESATKDEKVMFENLKPTGDVAGTFLCNGKTLLDKEFFKEIRGTVDLEKYPIIALGAAMVPLQNVRDDKLRTGDPQPIYWKWNVWEGSGGNAKGKISGRIIAKEDFDTLGGINATPTQIDQMMDISTPIGIDDAEVGLEKGKESGPEVRKSKLVKSDTNGIFEINDAPLNMALFVRSKKAGSYNLGRHKLPVGALVLSGKNRKIKQVIVPLESTTPPGDTAFMISCFSANPKPLEHNKNFTNKNNAPFGLRGMSGSYPGTIQAFKINKKLHTKSTDDMYYMFFITQQQGNVLDSNGTEPVGGFVPATNHFKISKTSGPVPGPNATDLHFNTSFHRPFKYIQGGDDTFSISIPGGLPDNHNYRLWFVAMIQNYDFPSVYRHIHTHFPNDKTQMDNSFWDINYFEFSVGNPVARPGGAIPIPQLIQDLNQRLAQLKRILDLGEGLNWVHQGAVDDLRRIKDDLLGMRNQLGGHANIDNNHPLINHLDESIGNVNLIIEVWGAEDHDPATRADHINELKTNRINTMEDLINNLEEVEREVEEEEHAE